MPRFKKVKGIVYPDYIYMSAFEGNFVESIPKDINFDYEGIIFKWERSTTNRRTDENISVVKKSRRQYTPDVTFPNSNIVLELKGYLKQEDKERLLMFKQMYPEIEVRLIFQRNGKVGTKMTYLRWAEIKGFKACVAKTWEAIPAEWKEDIVNG